MPAGLIVNPKTAEYEVSHASNIGVARYSNSDLYSPDTDMWKSKVLDLDLTLPKYAPNDAYVYDKSRYHHTCTVTGALWTPQGRSFDGTDDFIDCGYAAASMDITAAITIQVWFRPEVLVSASGGVLSRTNYTTGYTLMIAKAARTYQFYLEGVTLYNGAVTSWATNTWQMVTATYDSAAPGNNLIIYQNGAVVESSAQTGTITISANNLLVGKTAQDSLHYKGMIGEVWLYNRALTAAEIMQNYLATRWRYT